MAHIAMKNYIKNKTYLYNKGDECLSITGGWGGVIITDFPNSFTYKSPVINTGYISLNIGHWQYTNYVTLNKIDVTPYKYIKINVTNLQFTGTGYRSILFFTERNKLSGNIYIVGILSAGVNFIDISQITGEYYIGVVADLNRDYGTIAIDFNKIWFET